MNKTLILLAFLLPLMSLSQKKTFVIEWEDAKVLVTSISQNKIPFFKSGYEFTYEKGLTFFQQWKVGKSLNASSASLSNVSFEVISKEDLFDLQLETIPNKLSFKLSNVNGRGEKFALIEVVPIINDNGVYKKITAFTLEYDFGNFGQKRAPQQGIVNSVLRSGDWYRFAVEETGVYRLSKSFLSSLGLDTNVNPRMIKVFGQGGQMLPMANAEYYPFDLTENPIQFVGEEDGVFDDGDYILFYAEGVKGYNEESNTNINSYSEVSYYYVTVGTDLGKRIQPMQEPTGEVNETISSYHSYKFHEVDDYNLANMGRRWFGDRFNIENEKSFEFEFPNIDTTSPVRLKAYVAATSETSTYMTMFANGSQVVQFQPFVTVDYTVLAGERWYEGDIYVNSPNVTISLDYNNGGNPSSSAYVDYISLEARENLVHNNLQFKLINNDILTMEGIGQYNISNASSVSQVWDITDKYNITAKANQNSDNSFSFKGDLGQEKEYVVIDPSDYYDPLKVSGTYVNNQNIKGTIFNNDQGQFEDVDYLIITRNDMLSQAQRLAEINRIQNSLNVKVLTLDQIYMEFSSGNPDISAIRNVIKYVYDNASSEANRLKYVCLFGDGSYDYKDRISGNTNVVPSWQSYPSFILSGSFVADDFFGMMDDTEGQMTTSDRLDIAIGRILADTPQRAEELVDKIENYYSEASFGAWRNNILLIADDVDVSWEAVLQETSNSIADEITLNKPFINAKKIIADAYVQQATAGGERYPEVNQDILTGMEVGVLLGNYFGHGGEDGLAGERVFDKINAQDVQNNCRLNCFVTVTCEYTKFDNPDRPTAGEYLYWNKDGGAISLITTTRQIFSTVGVTFNEILGEHLFGYGTTDYVSMAEALRRTKNDPAISGISQNRIVFFIGDPAMKLAIPQPNIVLTRVNDVPIENGTEVLEALSTAKIEGEITDDQGNFLNNYNGTLTATIYDKEIQRSTLGNDGVQSGGSLLEMDFVTLGEIIFRGQASITNGKFEFDFVVPRDIGIPVGNGKVSFYAKEDGQLNDKTGANLDIKIGGVDENAPEDNQGPLINLYMNDDSFVSGGVTNASPSIFAKLYDENGINTASGIGHDIVAIVDGDETNPFKLNDYYLTNVDDYQNGTLSYPLRDLEPGLHTLTLKAWDVYNNSSETEIQFVVHDESESLVITNVLNYPNPFVNYTEFWFNHNSSDVLDVSVQIFTISGKLIKTLNSQTNINDNCCSNSSLSRDIVWDGRDDFGDRIGKGVYVYKLTVRSTQLNKQVEKIEKLVIL
ncbi:MAG: type IX secretion system sortase PorU [Flavobacteriaceae bacterium]|nr:type IX secretion system sortase PorU [Flavobacteriaceae bacterium]